MIGTGWSILWPDKSALTAETPRDLLLRIAALQWEPCSLAQIRARLVDRARVWSGVEVAENTTDEQFLWDLAAVGMFVLAEPFAPGVYNRPEGTSPSPTKGD